MAPPLTGDRRLALLAEAAARYLAEAKRLGVPPDKAIEMVRAAGA